MNARRYVYIKAFSDLGSYMDTIVFTSLILTLTHSTWWTAFSMALRTLGGLLSSISSGVLADRFNRRKLMIASDVLRALSLLTVIFWPTSLVIQIESFLLGFLSSYFGVAFSASVPEMFGEDEVVSSNALISRLSAMAMVLGFFISGVLTSFISFRLVIGLDFLSYALSALALSTMKWHTARTEAKVSVAPVEKRTIRSDLREAGRYLTRHPILCMVFLGLTVETFSASSHNLGIPILANDISAPHQAFLYGTIWGVWGLGNILSTSLMPRLKFIKTHLYLSYWIGTFMMSVGFITFLSNRNLWIVLPFALFTGVFDAVSTTLFAIISQSVDSTIRGRIIGVATLINRLGFGLGFLVAPLILSGLGLTHMVWVLHGLNMLAMIVSVCIGLYMMKKSHVSNPLVRTVDI